jgi:tetratricopeptide (TPR) repeat protein
MYTKRETIVALMEEEHYIEALQQLHQINPKEMEEWTYCYVAGECYRMIHNLDFAYFYLFQAYSSKRNNTEITYSLGLVCEKMGWNDEAKTLFQEVIAHNPDCIAAYHRLGVLCARVGKVSEAITWFMKGLDQIESLYRRNIVSLSTIEGTTYRKSVTQFDYLFPRDPIDESIDLEFLKAVLLHDIGICHDEMGEPKKAQEWFFKSVETIPEGAMFEDPFVYLGTKPNSHHRWNEIEHADDLGEENKRV